MASTLSSRTFLLIFGFRLYLLSFSLSYDFMRWLIDGLGLNEIIAFMSELNLL